MKRDTYEIPKLSVVLLTYFHEKYIEKALDSILNQKTEFLFEVIVGDDYSTDGTREKLLIYKDKYPEIIKLVFNDENVGVSQNLYNLMLQCNGEYICVLAGDDYYINEYALQKQADILDGNLDYYATATCIESRVNGSDITIDRHPEKKYRNREITLDDFLKDAIFPTLGIMLRNDVKFKDSNDKYSLMPLISRNVEDFTFCIVMLKSGKVYVNNEFLVGHRVFEKKHNAKNYNTITTKMKKYENTVSLINGIYDYFSGDFDLSKRYLKASKIGLISSITSHSLKKFIRTYNTIPCEYKKPWYKKMFFLRVLLGSFPIGISYLKLKLLKRIYR